MLKNNVYNILHQLVQENKSLWRIKNEYLKDCENDPEMTAYWNKLEMDKEEHVAELVGLAKKHL